MKPVHQLVANAGAPPPKGCVCAFDFDYTIVGQNTDAVARDLLLPDKLPKGLTKIIDTAGWTEYMAEIFRQLHHNDIGPNKIREAIRCIPEIPGFVRLLKRLYQSEQCDLIIISDSNSVFIKEWLLAHNLLDCFVGVYTNPARFEDNGLLTIKPYHNQIDCRLSAPNLCKGQVLEHFLVERDLRHNRRYDAVIYVGDGNNDFCPVLRCLGERDYACPRRGYSLDNTITKNRPKLNVGTVLPWESGFELLKLLSEHFETFKLKPAPAATDEEKPSE